MATGFATSQSQQALQNAWHSANNRQQEAEQARRDSARAESDWLRSPQPAPAVWPGQSFSSAAPGFGGGIGATLREPTSASEHINRMFDAKEQANLNALRAAFDQNVLTLDAARAPVAREFGDARNQAAAQSAIQRANFHEFAAGRGLNSGAGGQAYLAMNNALQGNLSNLRQQEAEVIAAINLERAKLETAYRNDVAGAIASGNLARAQALYEDFVRVDNLLVSVSQNQADLDLRTWRAQMDAALAMARLATSAR
ncbi:MAG: hypothetical protein FWC96_07450 [Oscillospiraceae bacterium]|nr:hypothetical protein [Oscillospiraceae bacterium]